MYYEHDTDTKTCDWCSATYAHDEPFMRISDDERCCKTCAETAYKELMAARETVGGFEVRILLVQSGPAHSVIGAFRYPEKEVWIPATWNLDGSYYSSGEPAQHDLKIAPLKQYSFPFMK